MSKVIRQKGQGGFSLVEVTLSIGLVAFCMVALLGLLPVGLGATGSASRQAEGARLLEQFSSAIQGAVEVADGEFSLIGIGGVQGGSWRTGGSIVTLSGQVDSNGEAVSASVPATLVYRMDIVPPADTRPASYGKAVLRVAWPAAAVFRQEGAWNAGKWEGAAGELEMFVMFRAP